MDHEIDNSQQIRKEEKYVVSVVATVLSDLCGPGEWMTMSKLHSEVKLLSPTYKCWMKPVVLYYFILFLCEARTPSSLLKMEVYWR